MKDFFKWDGVRALWTLVMFSVLGYFLPILSPLHGSTDIVQYGLPMTFFTVNLLTVLQAAAANQPMFSIFGFAVDILFAYVMGCLGVFIVKRFRESTSLVFRSILLACVFTAVIVVVFRVIFFGALLR